MKQMIGGSDSGLISIAMCTYNGERFLDLQIQSILDQTYKNLELVIVDDCSTDSTFQLLQAWQSKYPSKFKLYRNEANLGYNKNFEKAISLADGDFIAISDQDDIWLPEKVAKLVLAFTSDDVILTHCASVNLIGQEISYKSSSLRWEHPFIGSDTRKLFLFNQVQGHNMIFRKALKPHILPLPKDIYYDWWIAVSATCFGKINAIAEYLVHHRKHENNFYYNNKPSKRADRLYLLNALQGFSSIDGMKVIDKQFLAALITELTANSDNINGKFDRRLFNFVYRNRWIIFGHKKRLFPEWTLLKAAFKYARL